MVKEISIDIGLFQKVPLEISNWVVADQGIEITKTQGSQDILNAFFRELDIDLAFLVIESLEEMRSDKRLSIFRTHR